MAVGAGGGGGGFTVDPDGLHQLAADFERVAAELATGIASFSSSTQAGSSSTFGLVPGAEHAWQTYMQTAQQALAGLHGVHDALRSDAAGGLRTVAVNYVMADDASTISS